MQEITRRETLRRGLAATSLLALIPDWATPALAQDEMRFRLPTFPRPSIRTTPIRRHGSWISERLTEC